MVKRNLLFTIVLAVTLSGCSSGVFCNRSLIKETMAELPDGSKLIATLEVQSKWSFWCPTAELKCPKTQFFWERPGESGRVLENPHYKDSETELDEKLICVRWTHGQGNICLSDDGDRALLVNNENIIVVSLDYQAGIIIFGATGQPSWATVDMCKEKK